MRTPAEHLAKFNESVSILVKAYLNDTLRHLDCSACAVGNLVAASLGCEVKPLDNVGDRYTQFMWIKGNVKYGPAWHHLFVTTRGRQKINHKANRGKVAEQIEQTGYTWQQLAKVEKAFEKAREFGYSRDENMFRGLMSVCDVLASIHGVDLETTEAARKMFVKV